MKNHYSFWESLILVAGLVMYLIIANVIANLIVPPVM